MTDYIALRVDADPCSTDATDLIADALADIGYDSFVPDEKGVTAYIPARDFDLDRADLVLQEIPLPLSLHLSRSLIEGQDWNHEWEKNYFQPIVVGNRCVVHSSFHTDVPAAEYDIVIDPRMAFGTGHHSTTRLMIGYLLDADIQGKTVIDMGTGTGILAILSQMRGAKKAWGIEIDEFAAENARDNAKLNDTEVEILTGDVARLADCDDCDIFLANINRNIILADMADYAARLKSGGQILFSGFYTDDIPLIEDMASTLGLELQEARSEEKWAALRFVKK